MSKTNATPTPANQSAPASNDVPASAASSKPAFNYAAAAARSASSSRPGPGPATLTAATPLQSPSSFASAVGSNPSSSNPVGSSNKPSARPAEVSTTAPRPINGSTATPAAAKPAAPAPESRRTSVVGIKGHNVKACKYASLVLPSLPTWLMSFSLCLCDPINQLQVTLHLARWLIFQLNQMRRLSFPRLLQILLPLLAGRARLSLAPCLQMLERKPRNHPRLWLL